ncbi:thiol reductant ABC exporter subunit CydD [Agromyces atrinae]|uniref:ATP-binding cassette subfamily C protein CydD n=1 Tax=Agromyces atrinae TaxID=592376 RepID=A0A4Q2M7M3_9MICO|nr:thiol reductant ABC exporter subunit CydD [Agromyces atrinae]NYD65970.1 ATP-binding cassette subfamily C protein CydD [Agromyces atrinae]RXZ86303.1 thiol reductant ABC exporter subunit CydD [Agromyces atrinae]
MKPFDPRLLTHSRTASLTLAAGGVVGLAQTFAIIAFAWALAQLVVGAIEGRFEDVTGYVALLAAAVIVRATAAWLWDLTGLAGAARVKAELRSEALGALDRLGPGEVASRSRSDLVTTLGPGLDALDGYFAGYLPQLILTAIATPVLVLTVWLADPLSGIIVTVALPLIPIFMILIGLATQSVQKKQWDALRGLARSFLDLVGGLSTLIVYGRQHRQSARIRSLTEDYRRRTMAVLRVTFLSGFVLELAGSLSVALVAVSIGLRLVEGQMALFVGLFVLILTPEVFLPVRNVGARFHASAEGMTAADDLFAVIEASRASVPTTEAPVEASGDERGLVVRDLRVERDGVPVVDGFDLDAAPGSITMLMGESGAGKSTIVAALLGFAASTGERRFDGRTLRLDDIAWSGQSAGLGAGTVASNIALGAGSIDRALVARCAARVALDGLDPETVIGSDGSGLSGGQAARVAVARALYRWESAGARLLVLDEPSAALDADTEAQLGRTLRDVAASGAVVLVVTHRESLLEYADAIVRVGEDARV